MLSAHWVWQTANRWGASGYSVSILDAAIQRAMNSGLFSFGSLVGSGIVFMLCVYNPEGLSYLSHHFPKMNGDAMR